MIACSNASCIAAAPSWPGGLGAILSRRVGDARGPHRRGLAALPGGRGSCRAALAHKLARSLALPIPRPVPLASPAAAGLYSPGFHPVCLGPTPGRNPMDVLARATPPLSRPAARPRRKRAVADVPRLSVVVVNYLRWDDTARLVRQL